MSDYTLWLEKRCQKCKSKKTQMTETVHVAVNVTCDQCGHENKEVQWVETVTCYNCGHVEMYDLTCPTDC